MTVEQHIPTFSKYYIDIQNYFNLKNPNPQEFDFEKQVNSSKGSHSKLSTLTETQFLELSTDVHDELQRRSNSDTEHAESRLKPINVFHKKRNIAREKLSLLSESRFNDLLTDIMQEIERRDYCIKEISNVKDDSKDQLNRNLSQEFTDTSTPLKKIPSTDANTTNHTNKEDTIQQTVIAPIKASINWSSDEEEEGENEENEEISEKEDRHEGKTEEKEKSLSITSNSKKELNTLDQRNIEAEMNFIKDHQSNKFSNDNSGIQIKEKSTKSTKIEVPQNDIIVSETISINKDMKVTEPIFKQLEKQTYSKDDDEFDFNTPSKTMLTNNKTTTETLVMNELDNRNVDSSNTDSMKTIESLKNENLKLKQELEFLKNKNKNKNNNYTDQKILSNKHNLQFDQYIDPSGHIPLDLVKTFQSLTTNLYSIINESDHLTKKKELGNDLFTKIFQISKNLQEIMLLSTIPEAENNIILLRTALSHLITSIRYYCSFNDLLPKITVNTTISDLCFSFCNLVSVVKIKYIDPKNTKIDDTDFLLNLNEVTLVNSVDTEEILSPNSSSKVKPLRLAEKFHAFDSSTNSIDNNSNNFSKDLLTSESSISTTARSTLNKGLLYERIDIKSVASSQEKKESKKNIQMKIHKDESSTKQETPKIFELHNNETRGNSKKGPERSHSFMDRFKKEKIVDRLKHIGAK